jgi:hypothetical protein
MKANYVVLLFFSVAVLLFARSCLAEKTIFESQKAWEKANIIDEEEVKQAELLESSQITPVDSSMQMKKSQCPNNCNNHGNCISGICNCATGWAGIDCAVAVTSLRNGQTVRNTVNTKDWNYYHYRITRTGEDLRLVVNSTSGDCDLFVQRSQLPTRENYYARDVSSSAVKNFVLNLPQIPPGEWYIGVFGFSTCSYSMTAIEIDAFHDCPNGCSGHGDCRMGTCTCYPFYGGSDCSLSARQLTARQRVGGSVELGQWSYYVFNLEENTFDVIINETSAQGDVDIFVKYAAFPNETHFDYRDISVSKNFALTISTKTKGYWYIGVFGFQATSYMIQVVPYSTCLNFCSKHGNCDGNGCICTPGFNGLACENMIGELKNRAVVSGFVSSDMWNYYHFTGSTTNNIIVEVNQHSETAGADCDVYVRGGDKPTLELFDFRNVGLEDSIQITIPNPQFTTWYIGVYGYATCTYNVTQYVSTSCIPGCNPPFGQCAPDGSCICAPNYAGPTCSTPVVPLQNGVSVGPNALMTGQWAYYVVNTTSVSLAVHMKEMEDWSIGYYWLFVSQQTFPTLLDHDYSDMDTNTAEHTIRFPTHAHRHHAQQFYIGVYGSPFDLDTQDSHRGTYKLVAWGPEI